MKFFASFVFLISVSPACSEDAVKNFQEITGLRAGDIYSSYPEDINCPEGRLSIERDEANSVLVRMGANILAMRISSTSGPIDRERDCEISYYTKEIRYGLIDTQKTMKCGKSSNIGTVWWHSVIKLKQDGFDYLTFFSNGKRRLCHMKITR